MIDQAFAEFLARSQAGGVSPGLNLLPEQFDHPDFYAAAGETEHLVKPDVQAYGLIPVLYIYLHPGIGVAFPAAVQLGIAFPAVGASAAGVQGGEGFPAG